MTAFLKAKLKESNGQTNIDKHIVAAYKILQNVVSEQKINSLRHQKELSYRV